MSKNLCIRIVETISQLGRMRRLRTVTASTMIARLEIGRKDGCHKSGVEKRWTSMRTSWGRPMIRVLLSYAVAFALATYVLRQVRKPTKWTGRFFAWAMNQSHSSLTDWGLTPASIRSDFTILDVGCGGGRTVEKLAALAISGTVYGIDYAEGSVAASRAHNAKLIDAGRVVIEKASVSQL